jgi:FlaA1/EpsC-like NDP-sugar epimerase
VAGCAVALGARAGEKIHEELEKKDDDKDQQEGSMTGAGSDEAKPDGGK